MKRIRAGDCQWQSCNPFQISGQQREANESELSLGDMKSLPFPPDMAATEGPSAVSIIAVALLVGIVSTILLSTDRFTRPRKIPRTSDGKPLPTPALSLPLLGSTLSFISNSPRIHDWVCETSLSLGGRPWLLNILGRSTMVMLTSPEAFEDVQRKHFDKFGKGPHMYCDLQDFLGDGIVNVDGELWAFQRKRFASLLSSRALRDSMTAIIQKHSVTLDAVLEKAATSQKEIDVSKLLHQFTMEAFTEFGFGLELGSLGSDEAHPFETAFDDAQHCIMARMKAPRPVWQLKRALGIGSERHLKKCMALVHATVSTIIQQTMENSSRQSASAESTKQKTIVSLFLESEDAKDKLTPELLRDIVLNALLGGRDTSAEAMSWLFYCLSQHPEVEQKIRDEIAAKLDGDTDGEQGAISMDDLQRLTYLEAALKETLRLYPPTNLNSRYAYEDVTMSDGTFIPAGCYAVICPYTTGRRTDVWGDDATQFRPERWLDPSTPDKLIQVSSYKFNSFLGGPRLCLGVNLAMMQMKTVVVKTLRKFHFELSPGQQHVTYRFSLTLPIKDGLRVRVHRIGQH